MFELSHCSGTKKNGVLLHFDRPPSIKEGQQQASGNWWVIICAAILGGLFAVFSVVMLMEGAVVVSLVLLSIPLLIVLLIDEHRSGVWIEESSCTVVTYRLFRPQRRVVSVKELGFAKILRTNELPVNLKRYASHSPVGWYVVLYNHEGNALFLVWDCPVAQRLFQHYLPEKMQN